MAFDNFSSRNERQEGPAQGGPQFEGYGNGQQFNRQGGGGFNEAALQNQGYMNFTSPYSNSESGAFNSNGSQANTASWNGGEGNNFGPNGSGQGPQGNWNGGEGNTFGPNGTAQGSQASWNGGESGISGPNGQGGNYGPEGGPNGGGPNGQSEGGHRHKHHGGHHNPLGALNQELTGTNALSSTQETQIQQLQQQTMQTEQPIQQDLKLQSVTLAYDNATGNTAGATTAEQAIAADQTTMTTDKTSELQALYGNGTTSGILNSAQVGVITQDLTNKQQEISANSPQSGTPQDLMLQNVNLELAAATGSSSGEQTAQTAIAADQGTLLTNKSTDQQQRFASMSQPELQQVGSFLQNRLNELSGTDAPTTATTTNPTIASSVPTTTV